MLRALLVTAFLLVQAVPAAPPPARLSDADFWALVETMSEPGGSFHSENLVSNEIRYQQILPTVERLAAPGRAYVGVGSEQNFTYMNAVRPSIAVIVDLRRGNLDLHLIYKALFALSADRVEFVSRMFSRPKPAGLAANAPIDDIFAAVERAVPSEALYRENLAAVLRYLTTTRGFTLLPGDHDGIRFVYRSWFDAGPGLRYQLTGRGGGRMTGGRGAGGGFGTPTYAELMTTHDGSGRQRSYLADDASFTWLRDLQSRNLVIPIVGNFGGPSALRAAGAYLKRQGHVVSLFYTSNVEQYLRQDGLWDTFCANATTLPTDNRSAYIRSERSGGGFALQALPFAEALRCH